jgi:hypothetical protein
MKTVGLLIALTVGFSSLLVGENEGKFKVLMQNGGEFQVDEELDINGFLTAYRSNIMVPVCEKGVCYNVNIIFHWNIIGEFEKYETMDGFPLTKLDHVLFEPTDYKKLQNILRSQDLRFTGMTASELVKNEKLDGLSGATLEAIKSEVIEGALFTCHTLWQVANGAVVDSIHASTSQQLDNTLIQRIAALCSNKAYYFIINNLSSSQFRENLTTIAGMIKDGKGYFPKHAFEKIPKELFNDEAFQKFIINEYSNFSYYTQLAVLKKLTGAALSLSTQNMLLGQIDNLSNSQNIMLLNLLIASGEKEILLKLTKLVASKIVKLSPVQKQELSSKTTILNP